MKQFDSAIYHVRIAHQRSRPKRHHLRYGAFYLLLDLDELDRMDRNLRWFSVNSFNVFSFFDRDHGPCRDEPVGQWVKRNLLHAGLEINGGRIRVLCLPRIFGYAFNPLTVFFCYSKDGSLSAILYEVRNTFGERHSYFFKVENNKNGVYRHECEKQFYVSPFMNVNGRYHFHIKDPAEKLYLHIHQTDADAPILDAWVRGSRMMMSDRNLLASLARFPLLMLKVIAGIHWEALKLLIKGIKLTRRSAAPDHDVTFVDR